MTAVVVNGLALTFCLALAVAQRPRQVSVSPSRVVSPASRSLARAGDDFKPR